MTPAIASQRKSLYFTHIFFPPILKYSQIALTRAVHHHRIQIETLRQNNNHILYRTQNTIRKRFYTQCIHASAAVDERTHKLQSAYAAFYVLSKCTHVHAVRVRCSYYREQLHLQYILACGRKYVESKIPFICGGRKTFRPKASNERYVYIYM